MAAPARLLLGAQPRLELAGGQRHDVEEHERVVQPAQLGALGPVDARMLDGEVEDVGDPGLGVAAEVELGHVEAVDDVLGVERDPGGLAGRHDQARAQAVHGRGALAAVEPDGVGVLGGDPGDVDAARVLVAPAPLEGGDVDLQRGRGGHGVDLVLGEDGEPEQDEHHDDGDDDVGDLEGDVVLELAGDLVGLLAVPDDRPDDQRGRRRRRTTIAAIIVPIQSRNSSWPCLVDAAIAVEGGELAPAEDDGQRRRGDDPEGPATPPGRDRAARFGGAAAHGDDTSQP